MKIVLGIIFMTLVVQTAFVKGRSVNHVARFVDGGCTDTHIWIADGSVSCKYLEQASFWGLHTNPDLWCNEYGLTECCATCTKLRQENIIN